jgi:hypothetical protein
VSSCDHKCVCGLDLSGSEQGLLVSSCDHKCVCGLDLSGSEQGLW